MRQSDLSTLGTISVLERVEQLKGIEDFVATSILRKPKLSCRNTGGEQLTQYLFYHRRWVQSTTNTQIKREFRLITKHRVIFEPLVYLMPKNVWHLPRIALTLR